MNSDNIEALILSGQFFNQSSPHSRPSSPHGSDHSNPEEDEDQGWHDEELKNKINSSSSLNLDPAQAQGQQGQGSIGMGPGRTGVKGVIRDSQEARALEREQKRKEIEEMNRKMEKTNLGGKSYLEEERERARKAIRDGDEKELAKVDPLVLKELRGNKSGDGRERTDVFGRAKEGRFGHLREVGVHNFVSAVEKEERGVWVVVHLYEPSLDRCFALDETLAQLARLYPDTKFLRCRAKALGFASSSSGSSSRTRGGKIQAGSVRRPLRRLREEDDEDEDELGLDAPPSPYQDDPDSADDEDDDDVDTDVLPTVLVYRDGELVHNWVRVDWEAAKEGGAVRVGGGVGGWEAGVEELMEKHGILPRKTSTSIFSNLGLPSDGEDDDDDLDEELFWSEGERK